MKKAKPFHAPAGQKSLACEAGAGPKPDRYVASRNSPGYFRRNQLLPFQRYHYSISAREKSNIIWKKFARRS